MAKISSRRGLRILRLNQVLAKVGLSRSTVYFRIGEGTFPKQLNLGARAVGWLEHEIEEWLLSCLQNNGRFQSVDDTRIVSDEHYEDFFGQTYVGYRKQEVPPWDN